MKKTLHGKRHIRARAIVSMKRAEKRVYKLRKLSISLYKIYKGYFDQLARDIVTVFGIVQEQMERMKDVYRSF